MRTVVTSLALAGLLLGVGACVRHTEPLPSQEDMTPAERDFDNLWRASQYVLKKHHFTIDMRDRRAGLISTEPLLGKHFFEFWRHDSVTNRDTQESTLQTIYRIAVVTISRGPTEHGAYRPKVVVTIGRSNKGKTGIASVTDAYRLQFGKSTKRNPKWLTPLGRDEKLEEKLLYEIDDAAAKRIYLERLELPWPKPLR